MTKVVRVIILVFLTVKVITGLFTPTKAYATAGSLICPGATGDYLSHSGEIVPASGGTGKMSIEFWFKTSNPTGQYEKGFYSYGGSPYSDGPAWFWQRQGGENRFYNGGYDTRSITFGTNTWHHVYMAADDENDLTYWGIDGTVVSQSYNAQWSSPSWINYICASYSGSLTGELDDLRISNIVRHTGNYTPPVAPYSTDANTLLLLNFDEATGTLANDISGNNYDFTFNGATTWGTGYYPDVTPTPTPTPTTAPTPTPAFDPVTYGSTTSSIFTDYNIFYTLRKTDQTGPGAVRHVYINWINRTTNYDIIGVWYECWNLVCHRKEDYPNPGVVNIAPGENYESGVGYWYLGNPLPPCNGVPFPQCLDNYVYNVYFRLRNRNTYEIHDIAVPGSSTGDGTATPSGSLLFGDRVPYVPRTCNDLRFTVPVINWTFEFPNWFCYAQQWFYNLFSYVFGVDTTIIATNYNAWLATLNSKAPFAYTDAFADGIPEIGSPSGVINIPDEPYEYVIPMYYNGGWVYTPFISGTFSFAPYAQLQDEITGFRNSIAVLIWVLVFAYIFFRITSL